MPLTIFNQFELPPFFVSPRQYYKRDTNSNEKVPFQPKKNYALFRCTSSFKILDVKPHNLPHNIEGSPITFNIRQFKDWNTLPDTLEDNIRNYHSANGEEEYGANKRGITGFFNIPLGNKGLHDPNEQFEDIGWRANKWCSNSHSFEIALEWPLKDEHNIAVKYQFIHLTTGEKIITGTIEEDTQILIVVSQLSDELLDKKYLWDKQSDGPADEKKTTGTNPLNYAQFQELNLIAKESINLKGVISNNYNRNSLSTETLYNLFPEQSTKRQKLTGGKSNTKKYYKYKKSHKLKKSRKPRKSRISKKPRKSKKLRKSIKKN